ncbi:TPA: DUF1304 domain-containing protein [Streptococcus suis]
MHPLLILINMLTALLFTYIFYLETIATSSDQTAKTFNMTKEGISHPYVQTLFKNQGVYNLLIGLGLVYASFFSQSGLSLSQFLHLYIIGVAAYGAISSDPKILLKQGALSIVFVVLAMILT